MLNLSQLSKKLKCFFKKSSKEKLMFIQAFILCGVFRGLILLVPFNKLKQYMGTYNKESSPEMNISQYSIAKKIAWAVNRASYITPWESKCLVQALTAQRMLKRRHIISTLYLGIAKEGNSNLVAHAWLRCGVMIVTGGQEMSNFREIAKFSNTR